jgi:UTP:GlnB (protein PII) uridylyltransferase
MVRANLDVIDGQAYTRHPNGGIPEAVDLFWVQRARRDSEPERLTDDEIAGLGDALNGLLDGQANGEGLGLPSDNAGMRASREAIVRFMEDRRGTLSVLEVEADDRFGLLLAISQALFEQRVQIESSEVRTTGQRVFDRFSIHELDGSPIRDERRLEIQVAVMSALE